MRSEIGLESPFLFYEFLVPYLHLKLSNPALHNLLEIPECLEVNNTVFGILMFVFVPLYRLYIKTHCTQICIVQFRLFLLFLCCKLLGISYIHKMYFEQIHSHFPPFPPIPYPHHHFSFPTLCTLFYESTK